MHLKIHVKISQNILPEQFIYGANGMKQLEEREQRCSDENDA